MKTNLFEPLSWEPLVLTLYAEGDMEELSGAVRALLEPWFAARDAHGACSCHLQYLNVLTAPACVAGCVQVHCEWVCKKCLPALLCAIEVELRQVTQIDVGIDAEAEAGMPDKEQPR